MNYTKKELIEATKVLTGDQFPDNRALDACFNNGLDLYINMEFLLFGVTRAELIEQIEKQRYQNTVEKIIND
jgi:hypothetical protein